MKEINGVEKQIKLVKAVLDAKEVPLLIKDIETLEFEDTKYKSKEKFEHDRKVILETKWNVSTVLQNKTSKISELVDLNLERNNITDVNAKRIFQALKAKYKESANIDDNERAEEI